jgi:hypothetical protein
MENPVDRVFDTRNLENYKEELENDIICAYNDIKREIFEKEQELNEDDFNREQDILEQKFEEDQDILEQEFLDKQIDDDDNSDCFEREEFEREEFEREDYEDETDIDTILEEIANDINNDWENSLYKDIDVKEYVEIKDFYDELENYTICHYGETVIREDYWVAYCEEMCKEVGDIPQNLPWYISDNIDWDGVADELSADYSTIQYQGCDYYVRNS